MTVPIERVAQSSGKAERKPWITPMLQTIPVHAAMGSQNGPKCDKHGSLSHGTGCK